MRLSLALALLTLTAAATPQLYSYRQVRERVFKDPLTTPPPVETPEELGILKALLSGGLNARFAGTFADASDFKDPARKLIHRPGICADGTWRIDVENPATGLLAVGTEVPAILRFGVGTNHVARPARGGRTFGLAVKLFPTQDPDQPVATRNLFIFDQYGLDGHARDHVLTPDEGGEPIVLSNHTPANTLQSKLVSELVLARFDKTPLSRPLYPLTEVDAQGRPVSWPHTPDVIQLVPQKVRPRPLPPDFREELRSYAPDELVFDVVLPRQALVVERIRIGTLTVHHWVLSETCDGALHFHHHPTR
ncbi:MAG: hypothetical protein AB2A00_14660 [Myxococcota bacterium]